ncbi:MAG: type IV secretion system DNA-binding domain-containing protein [Candidatus Marsarchaeota archaeon]|nr:type IV secretion system DNA-binding domain-containing protein [Candidatus Marsarchaeota archaeon]
MGFLARLFRIEDDEPVGQPEPLAPSESHGPVVHNEEIPNALDLGLYYSKNKDELQVAKIAEKDRATHLYVVGATGTGKTKFLEFLIRQDITNGNGFGVIDPHGDLIEDIKGFLACRYFWSGDEVEVSERTVLIDPTDTKFTVTFNPLEKIPGVSTAEQAGELVSAFRRIWSDSWGVRMEDLMRNTLIALGEAELTLAELPPFLTHRAFREVVLGKVTNPTTTDYFRRFDVLTDRGQITWIEPVMNKINAFMADDRMRQMFSSSKTSFDFREVMDEKKWLLIKLDKGKLKDSTDLIGSLLMAKIQMAAFARSDVSPDKRVPFYFYIDEFQNFATESFKVVLSEARKYGLSLVMAHQSLSQIPDELRSLILGSAGVQVYFRVNRQDAQLLAKEAFQYSGYEVKSMRSFSPVYWSFAEEWEHKIEELQRLSPRSCYAVHKILGDILPLRTVEIEPAWEMLKMRENQYLSFLKTLPFGSKYLLERKALTAQSDERRRAIEEEVETRVAKEEKPVKAIPKPVVVRPEKVSTRETDVPHGGIEAPAVSPEADTKLEREHRRLQHLIKRLAEQSGYRAVIEQPTADGQGRVDVGLQRDGKRIACEVSVTTGSEQELSNIKKCLASGYDTVILCSPEKKTLEKVKTLCATELSKSDRQKVLFLEPDEIVLFFEEEAAGRAGKEERIKGYKVRVNFQPVKEAEKQTKRQAIAKVILQSFRRERKTE